MDIEVTLTFTPDGFVLEHCRGLSSSQQEQLFVEMYTWFDDHLLDVRHISLIESTPDKLVVQVEGDGFWIRTVNGVLGQKLGPWFNATISWKNGNTGE